MKYAAFSSRRQELQPNQISALELVVEDRFITDNLPIHWRATDDTQLDIGVNQQMWRLLANGNDFIIGDFPHVALEALNSFVSFKTPVYIRIYAIGGGFKRDTDFVRWARLK